MSGLDWSDPNQMVSQYFSVREALELRQWGRLAIAAELNDAVKENLLALCAKMDQIREFLNKPIIVTSMYRPVGYNVFLNIHPVNDVHSQGMAIDFRCPDLLPHEVQEKLRPELERFGLRMEKGTDTWTHLDMHPVIYNREFSV